MQVNCKLVGGLIFLMLVYLLFFSGKNEDFNEYFANLSDEVKLREFLRFNAYIGNWNKDEVRIRDRD